jgi:hypothetical protein
MKKLYLLMCVGAVLHKSVIFATIPLLHRLWGLNRRGGRIDLFLLGDAHGDKEGFAATIEQRRAIAEVVNSLSSTKVVVEDMLEASCPKDAWYRPLFKIDVPVLNDIEQDRKHVGVHIRFFNERSDQLYNVSIMRGLSFLLKNAQNVEFRVGKTGQLYPEAAEEIKTYSSNRPAFKALYESALIDYEKVKFYDQPGLNCVSVGHESQALSVENVFLDAKIVRIIEENEIAGDAHNIVVLAGCNHIQNILNILVSGGYRHISTVGSIAKFSPEPDQNGQLINTLSVKPLAPSEILELKNWPLVVHPDANVRKRFVHQNPVINAAMNKRVISRQDSFGERYMRNLLFGRSCFSRDAAGNLK